jgi:bifunctional non-homologous end joining protein LigD
MGLTDYNRKRDFKKTAEPPGRAGSTPTGRSFVIQKHAASRLHYDFRLEHGGVLKSWSVPKGPSFDPAQKRLAVETEDHPVEYGRFEGIIPKGEYGGGTVSLWDRGTWSPVGDVDKGLAEGHLKFDLEGAKLRGRWALVRLKPKRTGRPSASDGRSWLLVKDRDGFARTESELNVTEAFPDSVDSGRTLEEIAGARDRVWHSSRTRADGLEAGGARAAGGGSPPGATPRWVADAAGSASRGTSTSGDAPPLAPLPAPGSVTLVEARRTRVVPKGDGWVHEVELLGRRLSAWLADGTVTLRDPGGADRTAELPSLARSLLALPIQAAILDGVATTLGPDGHTRVSPHPDVLYLIDVLFLDGVDQRDKTLLERKAELAKLVHGSGGEERPAAAQGALRFADHVEGHGPAFLAEARRLGVAGIVSKRAASRYRASPKSSPAWRVLALEPGDAPGPAPGPAEVSSRRGPAAPPAARRPVAGPRLNPGEIQIAGVRLTHPTRVLYPDVGFTKRDLAEYYQQIATRMLPHVEDRPLTLVRAPQGFGRQQFYVRHPGDWAPAELRQAKVPAGTGSGPTMVADDLAGLVALAQMNVLEVHAWNGRLSSIEKPDRVVFDLDPGPEVSWPEIVAAARHVRAALELVDLVGFVKTTGSKGLHVVVPLQPSAGWKESMDFSHAVASALVRADGSRYTTGLAKAGRERKIFIDYLRNRRGATSISVYSTRARPGAPVSAPVAWDDLGGLAGPNLDRATAAADLASRPDPWRDYFQVQARQKVRQSLTDAIRQRLQGA